MNAFLSLQSFSREHRHEKKKKLNKGSGSMGTDLPFRVPKRGMFGHAEPRTLAPRGLLPAASYDHDTTEN
jgi:hypothetical protein